MDDKIQLLILIDILLLFQTIVFGLVLLLYFRLRKLERDQILQSNPLVPSPRPTIAGTKR